MTTPLDPAERELRELTSAVKRLRVAAMSDPSKGDDLADALVGLTGRRLLAWSFTDAATKRPTVPLQRIRSRRRRILRRAPDAVRYFTATAQLAAACCRADGGSGRLDGLASWAAVRRLPCRTAPIRRSALLAARSVLSTDGQERTRMRRPSAVRRWTGQRPGTPICCCVHLLLADCRGPRPPRAPGLAPAGHRPAPVRRAVAPRVRRSPQRGGADLRAVRGLRPPEANGDAFGGSRRRLTFNADTVERLPQLDSASRRRWPGGPGMSRANCRGHRLALRRVPPTSRRRPPRPGHRLGAAAGRGGLVRHGCWVGDRALGAGPATSRSPVPYRAKPNGTSPGRAAAEAEAAERSATGRGDRGRPNGRRPRQQQRSRPNGPQRTRPPGGARPRRPPLVPPRRIGVVNWRRHVASDRPSTSRRSPRRPGIWRWHAKRSNPPARTFPASRSGTNSWPACCVRSWRSHPTTTDRNCWPPSSRWSGCGGDWATPTALGKRRGRPRCWPQRSAGDRRS